MCSSVLGLSKGRCFGGRKKRKGKSRPLRQREGEREKGPTQGKRPSLSLKLGAGQASKGREMNRPSKGVKATSRGPTPLALVVLRVVYSVVPASVPVSVSARVVLYACESSRQSALGGINKGRKEGCGEKNEGILERLLLRYFLPD